MKYKTFRALVLTGGGLAGLAVCGGGGWWAMQKTKPTPTPTPFVDEERNLFHTLATPAATTPADGGRVSTATESGLRAMDRRILEHAERPLASASAKDVLRGDAWKVNVYQDAGHATPNRLKVDFDRDEKWDEKWSRDGAGWKRQLSTRDDEVYDLEFRLAGTTWVPKNAASGASAASTAEPAPTTAAASAMPVGEGALRSMDERILEKARQPIRGDKIKDAFPSERWKVNIYQDAGHARPNRLKIDFDRDEKWDEKWTFAGEEVKRQVAPDDDEVYSEEYRLRAGAWVRK